MDVADLLKERAQLLKDQSAELQGQAEELAREAEQLFESAAILERRGNELPPKEQQPQTRLEQLRSFLRSNGKAPKKEIVKKSGIPAGSIRAILNRKNFVQDKDGNWDNLPQFREAD